MNRQSLCLLCFFGSLISRFAEATQLARLVVHGKAAARLLDLCRRNSSVDNHRSVWPGRRKVGCPFVSFSLHAWLIGYGVPGIPESGIDILSVFQLPWPDDEGQVTNGIAESSNLVLLLVQFISLGAVVLEIFQGKQYGSIFGTIMLAALAGGAAGPWATGLLYDLSGSYTSAFAIGIAVSLLSAFAIWRASPGKVRAVAGQMHKAHTSGGTG